MSSSQILWAPAGCIQQPATAQLSLAAGRLQQTSSSLDPTARDSILAAPARPVASHFLRRPIRGDLTNERGFLPNEGTEISCASAETRFYALYMISPFSKSRGLNTQTGTLTKLQSSMIFIMNQVTLWLHWQWCPNVTVLPGMWGVWSAARPHSWHRS